jgi:hypothetical protein
LLGLPLAAFAVACLVTGTSGAASASSGTAGVDRAGGTAAMVAASRLASRLQAGGVSAPACVWAVVQTPSPPANSFFGGVATRSPTDAWAVGTSLSAEGDVSAFIEHWNGTAWSVVPSPNPGQSSKLSGVAVVPARNAWAVGSYEDVPGEDKALIEHWNGAAWSRVTSPHPGAVSWLNAVTAISWRNAWAVGGYANQVGGRIKAFVEHWNGRRWKQAATPTVMIPLYSVAAISWRNAWAVGYTRGENPRDVILHWNRSGWKRVPYNHPAGGSHLYGVATVSWHDVWAVGTTTLRTSAGQALAEHWNGTAWKRVPIPDADAGFAGGVTVVSSRNVWAAAGNDGQGNPAIEHWDGTNWTRMLTPGLGGTSTVSSVAASSARNVWAVGRYSDATHDMTFAVHC